MSRPSFARIRRRDRASLDRTRPCIGLAAIRRDTPEDARRKTRSDHRPDCGSSNRRSSRCYLHGFAFRRFGVRTAIGRSIEIDVPILAVVEMPLANGTTLRTARYPFVANHRATELLVAPFVPLGH